MRCIAVLYSKPFENFIAPYTTEYRYIDPEIEKVSVLLLVSGFYEVTEFTGEQEIKSLLFPELKVTAKQIFDV